MEELVQAYVDAKQALIQLLNEHSADMIGDQSRPLIIAIHKFALVSKDLEDAVRAQANNPKE